MLSDQNKNTSVPNAALGNTLPYLSSAAITNDSGVHKTMAVTAHDAMMVASESPMTFMTSRSRVSLSRTMAVAVDDTNLM